MPFERAVYSVHFPESAAHGGESHGTILRAAACFDYRFVSDLPLNTLALSGAWLGRRDTVPQAGVAVIKVPVGE